MRNRRRLGPSLGRFFLGSMLAVGLAYAAGWWSEVGSVDAKAVRTLPTPAGRPGLIYGVKVGWDGSRFLLRNTGVEKHSPGGEFRWLTAMDGSKGTPAVSVNAFHPAPDAGALVLGLEPPLKTGADPLMVLYSIAPDGSRIAPVGRYPEMEPIDLTVQPDGRVFLLATETRELNDLLCGHVAGPVEIQVNRLHELGPDGRIVRSFYPLRAKVRDAQEAIEIIDRMDQYRLASDGSGRLALYGRDSHDLIRIDTGSGKVERASLPVAGFPHEARIQNLSFTEGEEVVYTLVELDADSALSGCQTWQVNLESGDMRLLARRRGNEEAYSVDFDPAGRQLVVFDVLGLGARGFAARPYEALGKSGRDTVSDLFDFAPIRR